MSDGQPVRLGHARLAPSGFSRWSECPGSPDFEATQPEKSSVYADEGTAAHQAAEMILSGGLEVEQMRGCKIEVNGVDYEVGSEMVDALKVYSKHCRDLEKGCDFSAVETQVDCTDIHKDLWGTVDHMCFHKEEDALYITDLKYGRGVAVEAEENGQLMIYALGALIYLKEQGYQTRNVNVGIYVVQPRAPHPKGPIREYFISALDLCKWAREVLKPAAERCDEDIPSYVPGQHCRFCRSLAICQAQKQHKSALIKADFDDDMCLCSPNEITVAELEKILDASTAIRDWLKAVEAYAQAKAANGKVKFQNHKLVRRVKKRAWKDAEKAKAALEKMLGDAAWKKTLITPAQAEKLADKGKVSPLWEKPEGDLILVPNEDKRREVVPDNVLDFLDTHELLQ